MPEKVHPLSGALRSVDSQLAGPGATRSLRRPRVDYYRLQRLTRGRASETSCPIRIVFAGFTPAKTERGSNAECITTSFITSSTR